MGFKSNWLSEPIKDDDEKALDCKKAISELKTQLAEIRKEKFDTIVVKYEGKLSAYEFRSDMIDEKISQAENRGRIVSTNYYTSLQAVEKSNIEMLKKERKDLEAQLKSGLKSKQITKGSEMWQEMVDEINAVTLAIEESKTKTLEYADAIREIKFEIFDHLLERIEKITEESDFLIDLMSNKKLFEDDGKLTDQGQATIGLHGVNYNTYMAEASKYAKELKSIQNSLKSDPYNKELLDRRAELLKSQQEAILSAEGEKDAIVDLVEEGIDLELDALDKLIDSYTDALDAQKDLYDYQKEVTDQTKEIASLQKQLSAYENDKSDEAKSKIQQIKVSLEEAKSDLKDTEYDHYIDAQEELLSNLYDDYEEILNSRLDNVDMLMTDMIAGINENAATISETISTEASNVGYALTEQMRNIWDGGPDGAKPIITMYGDKFDAANTTLNTVIGGIATSVNSMVTALNAQANTDVKNVNNNQAKDVAPKVDDKKPASNDNKPNSNSSSSKKGSFFIKKKYTGKKSSLNKNSSIVDRLRYKDFDPSFNARKKYYKGMGFSGTYTGSASQNIKMLNWMKKNGFKNGARSVLKNQLAWTNEGSPETIIRKSDGAILTPLKSGDAVLNTAAHDNIWSMANDPTKFIRDHFNIDLPNVSNGNSSNDSYQNDFSIEFNLPNVTSYEEFVYAMQHDKKFEKMLQDMTINQAFGGSSLKKYKY